MPHTSITFLVAKEDIKTSNGDFVEKNDVGIFESESGDNVLVFFVRIWRKVEVNKENIAIFNIRKTGDGFSKKVCNICHKLLSTKKFAKNQNAKDNRSVRRPSCGTCRKELEGVNLSPQVRKEWSQKKPHNMPFECPICFKRTIAGVTCKIVLDHNHKTGEPRGWICDSCNTGIGRFKDDVEILKRAMGFLGYTFTL